MRKVVGLIACILTLPSVGFTDTSKTHLEKLRSSYPYGLIGDDYGLLTRYRGFLVSKTSSLIF